MRKKKVGVGGVRKWPGIGCCAGVKLKKAGDVPIPG